MYALISREKIQLPPGTIVRMPATWEDYAAMCQSRGDSAMPRLKYRSGELLLRSPLPRHGRDANLIADIVKVLLDYQEREYDAFTPIMMQFPEESGLSQIIASISTTGRQHRAKSELIGRTTHRPI